MKFRIKHFMAENGERFSQLRSGDDPWPMFHPTAFVLRSIRANTTPNTQTVYLEAIQRVYEWADQNETDLEVRFQRREFLRPYEIDGLVQHLRAARRAKLGETVSEGKGNTYVSYASQYLRWLADALVTEANDPSIRQMIETQGKRLEDKLISKTGSRSAKNQKILEKQLPEKARVQLQALWKDTFVDVFRSADRGSRLRNMVMLRILYETGMRLGELLALKLKSVLESTGGSLARLEIEKNHGDEFDTRINQPVAKTEGRIVPITAQLELQLIEYISTYRADVPRVSFDSEAFIFVTHRGARGQGQPLSISNFYQGLRALRDSFPALAAVHPHLLRHDWNYRFSKKSSEAKLNYKKEIELRRTLMGWSEKSEMPKLYNLRHIQEEALTIGLQVAADTGRRAPPSKETLAEAQKFALVVANA